MSNDLLPKIANKFYCESCNYITSNKYDYNKHILTPKHTINVQNTTFSIDVNSKIASKIANYECSVCNYYSKNKSNYDKHLLTDKHINKITGEPKNAKHICSQCNKEYSIYNSLWKHKKNCIPINNEREPEKIQNTFIPNNVITPELFMEVLKESKELQNVLIEPSRKHTVSPDAPSLRYDTSLKGQPLKEQFKYIIIIREVTQDKEIVYRTLQPENE